MIFQNLPESFDNFRIVLLSDLHDVQFGKNNKRLISKVQEADPDMIVIAGDILNAYNIRRSFSKQLKSVELLINDLINIAPVYFVPGNHDRSFNNIKTDALLRLLRRCGVHVLLNDYIVLENDTDQIVIFGINWRSVEGIGRREIRLIENIYESYGESFVIVLAHSNNYLSVLYETGVDLILSGHAHGGIIRLPFTTGLIGHGYNLFPPYTDGIYYMGDTQTIVSRGLGRHALIPRFLNNPHIAVSVLRAE